MLENAIAYINEHFPNHTYGVELECIPGIEQNTSEAIANALNAAGVDTHVESYNHATQRHWKITTDRSIESIYGGFEIVSPILRGGHGLEKLAKVLQVLLDRGVKVNRTCGLHVHVGANDLTADDIKNMIRRYAKHEESIDAIMPASRRGNGNRYCYSVARLRADDPELMRRFDAARDVRSAAASFGEDRRYMKLNIYAFLRHGTVEFRQHSGTIEIPKVINWVLFCLNFVKNSRISPTTRMVEQSVNIPFGRTTKAYRLYQMLIVGTTAEAAAAELDSTAQNITSMISTQIRRNMGVHVTKTNDVYKVHVPMVQEVVQALPPPDQTPFDGLPVFTVDFYRQRRESLLNRRMVRQ